jgi:hypothetical protein
MEKELEELRKNLFIEISASGGLGSMPGTDGTIITKDNKIYNYHDYWKVPEDKMDIIPLQYISEGKEIKPITIKKLNNYIKKHLTCDGLIRPFMPLRICDASFQIFFDYNNEINEIYNKPDIYSDIVNIIEKYEENFHCSSANPAGFAICGY